MKPLCLAPWSTLDISPSGLIRPCCKYVTKEQERMFITETKIEDYKNSEFLKDVKETMLKNEWPIGCSRCKSEEENNIPSKRQLDYERWTQDWDNYTEDKGFIVGSLAFGNTCNLKCVTCNSRASSRWRKEYKDLYDIDIKPVESIDNLASTSIYNELKNVIHFDLVGGEPFLSEPQKQIDLLSMYIESGQCHNISLHYTTNAQSFPEQKWWSLWENFKEIDIQLSIDGINDRYEYIRFPAKNNKLLENTKQYLDKEKNLSNVRLSVSHTVSAYNILYLEEFFTWCEQIGLPTPWCGKVFNPIHMRPCVFPDNVREKIANNLINSKYPDVRVWGEYMLVNNSSNSYDYFLEMKDKHDIYRKLNFAKTFPELQELLSA